MTAASSNQPSSDIKLVDAGGLVMISGRSAAAVEAALNDHIARGASTASPLTKVSSNWVAAYLPPQESSVDETSTFTLEELWSEPAGEAEKCRIEMLGFKWIITASTAAAVKAKLRYLVEYGARSLSDIERTNTDEWMVACDAVDLYETYLKW